MARVELEAVSKTFAGGVRGVNAVSLAAEDGEIVVLVGPSGSGKTTILRLVAGLERPISGVIRMGGREVTMSPPRERDVAYVPQSCPLYPHLRVVDNLAFGGRIRHGSILTRWWRRLGSSAAKQPSEAESGSLATSATISARVTKVAQQLGIDRLLERWPRQLSGGERQRVALGRALVREPAAFLLDEPLASLDAALRWELRAELKQLLHSVGRATLYVTHDQAEALALADRVVVLEAGEVRQIGTPDDVYDRPANRFVATFIGSPPMNVVTGTINENNTFCLQGGEWKINMPAAVAQRLPRGEVQLGLRAEAIAVVDAAVNPDDFITANVISATRQGETRELTLVSLGGLQVVAKVDARTNLHQHSMVAWKPHWPQAHWFDSATGKRIEGEESTLSESK
jgi:multiple sugar transport system ATP-binding protein